MSTPVTTYDKRPVIVSPTAPTSLEQLRYLWLDISETTPVLKYYNSTGIWEAINGIDTSSFLTTNGVQTITGAKTFNTGTITVADITVDDVTIEGIDTIKLTDDDTHVPTSKLVEDTIVSAISGLETSIDGKLATKANDNEVVKLTGDQVVQGVKEFGNDIYFSGSILFGTSSSTMSSFNNVDQYLDSPSTTTVPSTQAVTNALSEKQNTLKYYSEGTNTVTIKTPIYPNTNVSIKAGATGLEMGHGSSGTSTTVKLGVFSEDTVSQGLTVAGGDVDIAGDFHINGSSPNVTTIVDSINMEGGGENALPTASAVRIAISQIKTDLGSALTYKGSVDTYDQLPEEAAVGDTWNVAQAYQTYPAGTNYAWTGTAWDALGGSVDLSGYQTKSDDTLATSAKTVVGAINELNTQVTTNTSSIAANTASITALEDGTSEEIDVAGWKSKLGFITAADQVQPDWTAASGKAQILNKPDVETKNSVVVIGATNAIASVAGIVTNTQQVTTGSASLTCNYNVNGNAKLDFVSDAGDMIEILIANEGSSNFSVIKECTCGEDCLTITNVTWEASGNYAMTISYTATKDGDAKLSYMYGNA